MNLSSPHGNGHPRFWEEDPWRVLRIMSEFVDSFEEMSQVPPGITIFGSARTPESDPFYKSAVEMGRRLVKNGFSVITGGGPGNATKILPVYLFEVSFKFFKLGRGAAIALILLIVTIILGKLLVRVFDRQQPSKG